MINQINLKKFNKIYDETYNNILKCVLCECSNISDVNDIIQEIYLEVYKKINDIENIQNIDAYIVGIAKNKVKKYYRFRYKFKILSLNNENINDEEFMDNIPSNINVENMIMEDNDLEIIWSFLKKKKIVVQKIFYLYYSMDFTIKEIASSLNKSESYIKNNLYRTLRELQNLLGRSKNDK